MSTVGTLLDRALYNLVGTRRSERSTLSASLDGSETGVKITTDSRALQPGAWLQVESELMAVIAAQARSATVERGAEGSTAATHSAGVTVTFNPRFWRHRLLEHFRTEVLTLPRDKIWRVTTTTCSFAASSPYADLVGASGEDVLRLLSARREPIETDEAVLRNRQVELVRDQPTSRFTSGYGVQLIDRFPYARATDLRVTYSHAHQIPSAVTLTEATDIQSDLNIDERLEQALVYGVCWRAMATTEVVRTDQSAQGNAASAADVPPTHRVSVAEEMRRLRDLELSVENQRLLSEYGITRS